MSDDRFAQERADDANADGERPYLDAETKSALHLVGVFAHGRLRAPVAHQPGQFLIEIDPRPDSNPALCQDEY